MENNAKRLRKCSAIALGIVLATSFVLVLPTIQNTYAQVTDEGIPTYHGCEIRRYLGSSDHDLVEMTTVRSGNIAKTIHSEKQIYDCETVQGGIDLIVDQLIIAEVYENMNTQEIVRTQAEVVTCVQREDNTQFLGCETEVPGTDVIPLANCFIDNDHEFATSQNTVNKAKIVKTIHAEKSIFFCDLDNNDGTGVNNNIPCGDGEEEESATACEKKVDQVIFTEIWEDLDLLPNDPVTKKEFLVFTCVVVLAEDADGDGDIGNNEVNNQDDDPIDYPARVESCRFQSG
jgi:hypothetical protein